MVSFSCRLIWQTMALLRPDSWFESRRESCLPLSPSGRWFRTFNAARETDIEGSNPSGGTYNFGGVAQPGRAPALHAGLSRVQILSPPPDRSSMKIFALFGRPHFLRSFHGWSTAFWLPFTAFAYATGWLKSIVFVSLMSMIALFLGSFSAWQAARVEVKQEEVIEDS